MNIAEVLKNLDALDHAYMTEGSESARDALLTHLKTIKFDTQGHPDAFVRTYESFGIDESREVALRATRKPLKAGRNIFVLTTPSLTQEAQNALLKTFEEPASVSTFFLITPSVEILLPTLRSRMQLITHEESVLASSSEAALEFLSLPPAKRLKQIEPLLKERKQGEVIAFLSSLERVLATSLEANPDTKEGLRAVYRARAYAGDKGALLKVLLEQVSLLAPQM